jgi:predicted dienelactone hydrolase
MQMDRSVPLIVALLLGCTTAASSGQNQAARPARVGTQTTAITDAARQRQVGIKFYYPLDTTGPAAVILISHGGDGSDSGENALSHLGSAYAAHGFLAVSLGHRRSADQQTHRRDRPADVSFVLDAIARGDLALPKDFRGTANLDQVGHVGHSWGAYTAHAVAGARFDQGQFRDPRVDAIVAISPQGPDQFGSFDRGPDDNSWSTVRIPAFVLAGGAELHGPPAGYRMDRWRAKPFERFPAVGDKFLAILPDQNHGQMGGGGAPSVQTYIAENTAAFFDAYVRGRVSRACEIGRLASFEGTRLERKPDPNGAGLRTCPPLE